MEGEHSNAMATDWGGEKNRWFGLFPADGLTTDDEFTPYIFNNGKLVGIGWQVLGGPKSQGQATSDIYIQNRNTTIVY